jgi:hypothetical protein
MRRTRWALVLFVALVGVLGFLPGHAVSASAVRTNGSYHFAAVGGLDCNGFSAIQQPIRIDPACAHPRGGQGGEVNDNGHYIGHDEPNIRFISNAPGSGNSVTFKTHLPTHDTPSGSHPIYQETAAFWFGMALCDNRSFPQHVCINDSDLNTGLGNSRSDAGSAVLEMQFYPPGYPNFFNNISCDTTHWCASLHINSLECSFGFVFCNPNCTEPTNFAFITKNGVPIGPPGPASQTLATFDGTNPNVLKMNPGDVVVASIHDTPNGLFTGIHDLTSGKTGFMVASAANGFQSLELKTCKPHNYSFHPEYDSAAAGNIVPWAALQLGVSMDVETGHFEIADHDADDTYCGTAPVGGASCLSTDFDFDGVPYHSGGWPEDTTAESGSTGLPGPMDILPMFADRLGPSSHGHPYEIYELETDVGFTVNATTSCNLLLPNQCGIPTKSQVPTYGGFYPYWSNQECTVFFGAVNGPGITNHGGDAGYGVSQASYIGGLAVYGTNAAFYVNQC